MARTKKDFDKESMFSKIMPTAINTKSDTIESKSVSTKSAEPTSPPPSALPVNTQITNPHMSALTLCDLGSGSRTHNIMEDLVLLKINEVLDRFNCCKCEVCRQDIIAIALNSLPPKYVAATEQKMKSKIQMTMVKVANDTNAALVKAAIVVRNNPRHKPKD